MSAPGYSLTDTIEWCQAMRENAAQRAHDFAAQGSPFSPEVATEEAIRSDWIVRHLRAGQQEKSRGGRT